MGCLATAHETLRPLGIMPEDIKLVLNDTALAPDGGPAGGSRSQVLVGNSIKVGCELLLSAMKKNDGTYRTYDEMIAENIPVKHVGKWAAPCTACDENGQGNPFPTYMYGVFLAEVEVDTKTGKTAVVKMTLAADVGKIANKLVVDGQIYGGLAQGIGLALTEDFEDLKKHTTMVGCGLPFIKYIPDAMEVIYRRGAGEAVAVADLERACVQWASVKTAKLPAIPSKGQRAAVVGSGLSGLTVAYELSRKGYEVTVFESSSRPGGRLRELASEKLPPEVLDSEISMLENMRVAIRLNTCVGRDVTLNELCRDFAAVYLGTGTNRHGFGLPLNEEVLFDIHPVTCETGRKGVFAGGSACAGDRLCSPVNCV